MNIYFSASIRGGRQYLEEYRNIVQYLKSKGHTVSTEHIADENVLAVERLQDESTIFERDIEFLDDCDAVIAEVSNPSLGVGYEICYAVENSIETLCVYKKDVKVSAMIIGNTSPHIHFGTYSSYDALYQIIDDFLENL